MRAYVEAIYVFKTKKKLALNTLKKKYARMSDISLMSSIYDDYSQRLIPAVPYPLALGIQTILDHLVKTRPEAGGLKPNDFIDASIWKEIEDSGFVKKLYGN